MIDGDGAGGEGLRAELSIAALARRFGVSRPHVLRVIREAEAAGLLERPGDGGSAVDLTPLLVRSLATFYAAIVQMIASCAEAGLAAAPTCSCCPEGLARAGDEPFDRSAAA